LVRLAITPKGIFSAKEWTDLDMTNQLKKFNYKIDVRYQRISLVVSCDGSCTKRKPGGANVSTGEVTDNDVKPVSQ
jgi:hypothetical protein